MEIYEILNIKDDKKSDWITACLCDLLYSNLKHLIYIRNMKQSNYTYYFKTRKIKH